MYLNLKACSRSNCSASIPALTGTGQRPRLDRETVYRYCFLIRSGISSILWLVSLTLLHYQIQSEAQADVGQSRRNAIVNAVEMASPAVVNISTTRIEHVYVNPFFEDFWRSPFFDFPRIPQQREQRGLGSGVILDDEGYILTNFHVIENADLIQVILSDGRQYKAKLVGEDVFTDLAVLKVGEDSATPIADLVEIQVGDSGNLLIGEWAIAIGHPFATSIGNPKPTVTIGVISATDRSLKTEKQWHRNLIQTDASINPGNSGGALVNARGQLIGINTAIYSTSGGSQGVGFAIPVSTAIKVYQKLVKYGAVVAPTLGITTQELTPQLAEKLEINNLQPLVGGILVSEVDKQTGISGLKRGDVITTIDNQKVLDLPVFRSLIRLFDQGETVVLQANRKGKPLVLKVQVSELEWNYELKGWGIRAQQPDRQQIQRYTQRGVVVSGINRRSELAKRGLRKGDLIYQIGDVNISTLEDLKLVANLLRRNYPFSIHFERGGQIGVIRNLIVQ